MGHICSNAERVLLVIPVKLSALGLQNLCKVANNELMNFKKVQEG